MQQQTTLHTEPYKPYKHNGWLACGCSKPPVVLQFECPAIVPASCPSLMRRLKVSGPYYSEIKQSVPALADGAAATGTHPAAAAGDSAQPAAVSLSVAAIHFRVEAAVAAVMGAVPGATEPLVEAGLDSLGGSLPPTSASVADAQAQD